MNPKSTRKASSKATKSDSKKKVKNEAKVNDAQSKFYVNKDGSVNEPPPQVIDAKPPPADEPKKLERSNSFYLTRKLSKIYTKLSGSKENLDKLADKENPQKSEVTPFRFQRSLTLNSIQLKKSYRKPFHETRLENLSEEKIENDKAKSPPMSPPISVRRSQSPAIFRQSMPPGSFDEVDQGFLSPPPKFERSNSFISLFKRKVSFQDSPKPGAMTSNWAASLQNLQQIDNMVSYEDLSFVDYDKFNQYENHIEKLLIRNQNKNINAGSPVETANTSVVRRRQKTSTQKARLMGDFSSNLDREKNLYRQSIDSNKLRFLSSINSDTHRWSQVYNNNPIDWLSLENTPQAFNPIL